MLKTRHGPLHMPLVAVYLISEKAVLWQVPNQPLEITPLGVLGEEIIYGNGRSGRFLDAGFSR